MIIDADADRQTRHAIASRICWRLALEGTVVDVFVQSERVVRERERDVGSLTYYALKEGVAL